MTTNILIKQIILAWKHKIPELMDDVAMNMCNHHNKLDYEVAPTLFLEFHGTQDSVKSQAESVGKQKKLCL